MFKQKVKVFKIRVFLVTILSVFLVSALFSGCSMTSQQEKITVVLDYVPNTNHTGLYVAKDLGYFEKEGIEVDLVQPPDGGALSLLAAGKAQFGISFQEELAMALSADSPLPVTAVATIIQHNTSGIISLKKSNIKSPKDLEGKRYASWAMPIEKPLLTSIMKKDGGDFTKIKMIPTSGTDVIAELKTNIDAVWIYYGWDGIAAEVKKLDFNYFAFKDIDPVFDFYTPIIVGNNDFLAKKPEFAKKFLSAVSKGYEYAIANPEAAAKILVKYAPATDLEIATKSQIYLAKQYKAEVNVWGQIDETRWTNFYKWLFDNQVITKKLEGQGFTNEFLPK